MKSSHESALTYIARIKNSEKKRYAVAYYEYCLDISDKDPSYSSTFCCGYLAKQAVKLYLASFDVCPENRADKGKDKSW